MLKMTTKLPKVSQIILLLTLAMLSSLINCQQVNNNLLSPQAANFLPTTASADGAEARADNPFLNARPQQDVINQLYHLINNYANSNSNNPAQARPFPQMSNQQVSTPVNPFLRQQQPFQSTRQNPNFPNLNNQLPVPNNNRLFPSSSPATPLTLNRINLNLASNQNQPNRISFNNQPMPLNPQQQQQQSRPNLQIPLHPARGIQPMMRNPPAQQQQPQFSNQLKPNLISTPIPLPAIPLTSLIKSTSGGFAPSGPPPTTSIGPSTVTSTSSAPIDISSPSSDDSAAQNKPVTTGEQPITSLSPLETTPIDSTIKTTTSNESASATPVAKKPDTDAEVNSQESNWNPVELNRTTTSAPAAADRNKVTLVPSPDIVTVPPGYNPDNPRREENYDISVSAQMGGSPGSAPGLQMKPLVFETPNIQSKPPTPEASPSIITVAPTATTTIIWSPPATEVPSTSVQQQSSQQSSMVQPTKTYSTLSSVENFKTVAPPTRIRDNSMLNDEPTESTPATSSQSSEPAEDQGVVYGKPQAKDSKPAPPSLAPSPVTGHASIESSVPAQGRPFIQPVQLDNQVRPFLAGAQQQMQKNLLKSNHGSSPKAELPFKPSKQIGKQDSGNVVNSGFTITGSGNQTMPIGDIQDYVANQPAILVQPSQSSNQAEPTITGQGGQDPASFDLTGNEASPPLNSKASNSSSEPASSSTAATPRVRRPTFKPKPAVPPIRIDSCIVGDDSSCDQSHNERCFTEYGISSCHCKPGFARLSQLRGYCNPVSSLQLSMKIDKLSDDRRLTFNHSLENSNSEEYQYLEFETIQAIASAFQATNLARLFMGAKVNKFYEKKGKVWVNTTINFEMNNVTRAQDKIQALASQELSKYAQQMKSKPLGDSTIILDTEKRHGLTSSNEPVISKLVDVNECANKDLNDCSKYATCLNEFGGFQCQCLPGYEDKYAKEDDRSKHGRVCFGCSASYCSNRGECSIVDGRKQCKCKPNFIGSRCDIDSEVLAVAIGGSLVGIVILIITFWCLYAFNRRWKREQQKMDAMSATSGLTFNYVNSSSNSLMSPANSRISRSAQGASGAAHQVGVLAANYGQRLVGGLVSRGHGGGLGHQHHHNGHHHHLNYSSDQQAIIGSSTSSGSSAASQPITGSQYPIYAEEHAGLLIAPASNESSEQTSPASYTGGNINKAFVASTILQPGNAYTLSGHHHHHQLMGANHHHHHHKTHSTQLTQFHPAVDYNNNNQNRTNSMHCNMYDMRWRTLQQVDSKQQQVGYYLVSKSD